MEDVPEGDGALLWSGHGRQGGVLADRRGADGSAVVDLEEMVDDPLRGIDIADPPTGHGVFLGQGKGGEDPVLELGQAGQAEGWAAVVNQEIVGFVGDDGQVVIHG